MSAVMWADLGRDVVLVQGDDAAVFLHSQLANDVASMATGESRHSLLLEPSGHICVLTRVVRHADTVFTLDVETGHGVAVIQRLQRFVLRAKVTMRPCEWGVRAFRGADAVSEVGAVVGRAVPHWGSPDEIDVIAEPELLPEVGTPVDAATIDAMRVDAKWPRLGIDVLVGDIPSTSGALAATVSFTKGCYPGQELVERMDSRGSSAPTVLRSLIREGQQVGDIIMENGHEVGVVTSVGTSVALARVSRQSTVGDPIG